MKKSPIHFSKEERIATQSTDSTVSAIYKNTEAVTRAIKEIPVPKQDNSDVVKKLDEVKSASLITNQELKKIAKKPEVQKVEIMGAQLVTIKGDPGATGAKGAKGDRGEKGERGEQGAEGAVGASGADGKDGRNGDSIVGPAGMDGRDGKDGLDGKDAPVLTPDETVQTVNSAKALIDAERVRGLAHAIQELEKIGTNPSGAAGGGREIRYFENDVEVSQHITEINFGANITATYAGNGRVNITASAGGGGAIIETPTGAVDASNASFGVSAEPQYVVSDGVTYFDGAGYTYAALAVTMDVAPSNYIRAFV